MFSDSFSFWVVGVVDWVEVNSGVSGAGGAPSALTLVVEDNGGGIPEGERERILHRGARLDQLGAGHGLGLAVAADIVASYNGRLSIEASAAGGARVVIRLT